MTVPPVRVPKPLTKSLPTLATMVPWPPLAPRVKVVNLIFVLPLPRRALTLPETCTVPEPSTGSTAPPVIAKVTFAGFSLSPCDSAA